MSGSTPSTDWLRFFIGAVWIFHGLYSKILDRIPRHRYIVARILGERHARWLTRVIGSGEVLLGVWAIASVATVACAVVQTLALVAMNALEIARARHLLISPWGMVALNAVFLTLVWTWALLR